jgi:hypothetical protein
MTDTYKKYATFEIGRTIGRTFRTAGAHFILFFLGILAVFVLFAVLQLGVTVLVGAAMGGIGEKGVQGGVGLFAGLFDFACLILQLGFIVSMVISAGVTAMEGEKPRFGAMFAAGLRNMLPVGGLMLVAGIATYAASLLFLVPGIILSLVWAVILPAQVIEKKGFGAFGRSTDLTRNNRGVIFGFSLLMGLINIAIVGVAFLVFGLAVNATHLRTGGGAPELDPASVAAVAVVGLVFFVVYVFILVVASLAPASVYVELKGMQGQNRVAVFD